MQSALGPSTFKYPGPFSPPGPRLPLPVTASADGIWTVAPNRPSADLPGPPFQNATFYVPTAANATSRACGFAPGPAPQLPPATTASHWRFYGSVAVTSALQAFFFAEPVADEPAGVYALVWNATTAAAVPVVLKDAPPANDWRV